MTEPMSRIRMPHLISVNGGVLRPGMIHTTPAAGGPGWDWDGVVEGLLILPSRVQVLTIVGRRVHFGAALLVEAVQDDHDGTFSRFQGDSKLHETNLGEVMQLLATGRDLR